MFFAWLLAQRARPDIVGHFAVVAYTDPKFPRQSHRLYKLLRYCTDDTMRRACKIAHREWRSSVRKGVAA